MDKIRIFIVEGDEFQIKILEDYLCENDNIEIKRISSNTNKKNIITDLLHNLGVPSNIKGYEYIVKAVELIINSRNNKMIELYKSIAKIYNTKSTNIESSIRYAIEISWNRGDINLINSIFGYSIDSSKVKPTNTEYLTTLSECIINKEIKSITIDKW